MIIIPQINWLVIQVLCLQAWCIKETLDLLLSGRLSIFWWRLGHIRWLSIVRFQFFLFNHNLLKLLTESVLPVVVLDCVLEWLEKNHESIHVILDSRIIESNIDFVFLEPFLFLQRELETQWFQFSDDYSRELIIALS